MKPNINCPQEMDYVNPATNTIGITLWNQNYVVRFTLKQRSRRLNKQLQ
jgi:hypothetical protein